MSSWKNRGEIEIFLLIGIVILSVFLAGGIDTQSSVDLSPSNNQLVNVNTNPSPNSTSSSSQDLQIQTFNGVPITPPPTSAPAPVVNSVTTPVITNTTPASAPVTPTNWCSDNTGQNMSGAGCDCPGITLTCSNGNNSASCPYTVAGPPNANGVIPFVCSDLASQCGRSAEAPGNGTYCYAKPVIYLYPTRPTNISVKIQTSGKITVSDPLYGNGWDNVLAFPSGNLIYRNKTYSELFYETNVSDVKPMDGGIVVATKDIKQELYNLTARLGLIKNEQDELVNWWTPRLEALNKPYILVSLVDPKAKERTDKVLITPSPDTRIEFLLYFKGFDDKVTLPSLNLPQTPKRVGFTEVEWGGTIDYQ